MLDSWTLCAVLALASAVLFVAYLATTFVRYGYIVSPFNVIMFLAAVAFCLSPFFYLEDGTWASVWIYDAASMRAYLAQSLNINLLGTVVFRASCSSRRCARGTAGPSWAVIGC